MTSQTIESSPNLDDIGAPVTVDSSSCVLDSPSAAGCVMAVVLPVARPAQACE